MHLARGVAGAIKVAADTETRAACLTPRRQVGCADTADGEYRDCRRQHIA
jgi:hypothetical protein